MNEELTPLEALEKIDHTICLAFNENNNALFNKDKYEHIDCKDIDEFINCHDTIKKALEEYQEIKTYMQQYGIENVEELRRILHNDWVIRQKFKLDTANISNALVVIKEKRVDADYFIYTCVIDDWSYEDYLEEYNSTSSWFICGQRSFGYQGKKQPLLTREEYYLLKEVLSCVKA